jgi:phosphate transport system permease protein
MSGIRPTRIRLMWRKSLNVVMLTLTGVAAFSVVAVLFLILGYLIWNGGKSLNWAFFTQLPKPVGEEGGGMANAIVGSLKLLLLAAVMGLPVGLLAGIYLAEFGGKTFSFVIRYTTDLLNGVPSIVIGIFAYSLVVLPVKHFSTLAGGVALGMMVIPITVRATEEFLRAIPGTMREGAMALGASKWRTITSVILPAASGGIATGMLLALARVAGETAPLLFTAFSNRFWSPGWSQPIASLPVMIYTYAIAPYDDWHRQAWAAGLVLLGLVLVANLGCRLVINRRGIRGV